MKKRIGFRRATALVLCAVLLLSLLAGCDEEISAAMMQLEKTQGTVDVMDDKKEHVEVRPGMQLYSGYDVSTAQESLAWIALDKAKAAKLDASSEVEILLDGKKLTVKLHQGNLYFDVSEPLKEDETFTIETSTMITGIRGTCGWLEIIDPYTTRLILLEGTVEVESIDPVTGERRITTVTAGQILTVVYHEGSKGDGSENAAIESLIAGEVILSEHIIHEEDGLRIEELQEDRVPDFVRNEVANSPELQKRIGENTQLSVPEILGGTAPGENGAGEPGGDGTGEPSAEGPGGNGATDKPADSDDPEADNSADTQEDPGPDTLQNSTPPTQAYTETYYELVTEEYLEAVEVWPERPTKPDTDTGTTTPDTNTPSNPGTVTPEAPGTQTPENPGTTTPEDPGTNTPEDPGTNTPADPDTGTPEDPGTNTPEDPGANTPDDPGTNTPEDPGTETPDTPGGDNTGGETGGDNTGGETGGENGGGDTGSTTPRKEITRDYQPQIQLLPAANPTYARVTHMEKETETEIVTDADGNVLSSTVLRSELVPAQVDGVGSVEVPIINGAITFTGRDGNEITLQVDGPAQ